MILNIILGAGDEIAERMQGECLTVLDVLSKTDLSLSVIYSLLQNKQQIDFKIACELSKLFDTSIEYWLNFENEYQNQLRCIMAI